MPTMRCHKTCKNGLVCSTQTVSVLRFVGMHSTNGVHLPNMYGDMISKGVLVMRHDRVSRTVHKTNLLSTLHRLTLHRLYSALPAIYTLATLYTLAGLYCTLLILYMGCALHGWCLDGLYCTLLILYMGCPLYGWYLDGLYLDGLYSTRLVLA